MTDEAELLQRLRKREKNSIDEAIRIYTPYLSTVLYHMAGNSLPKEDIEEIVADVFVVLWKNAERIDLQKGTLRSYLAAVVRNFALKRINRKTDHTVLEDIEMSDRFAVPLVSTLETSAERPNPISLSRDIK